MELQKLRGNEIFVFKEMTAKYSQHDRVDLLIHKTLKRMGISIDDFNDRKLIKEKKEEMYVKLNAPPEEIKFCDGDKCELPVFMKEKC